VNLEDSVRVPSNVGAGKAEVTISFDAWFEGNVEPSRHTINVVAPKSDLKPEPISPRLLKTLAHPNRSGNLSNLHWSPDGKQILASDYPGNVIQLWDVATSKDLVVIECGAGSRGSIEDFQVSSDWRTVYIPREKETISRIERDNQRLFRFETSGEIRALELATGKLRDTYKHDPLRGTASITLSRDGKTILANESITSEGHRKYVLGVWDVHTKQYRQFPEELQWFGKFSPDGKSVALNVLQGHYNTAAKFFDVANGTEKITIPVSEKYTRAGVLAFSPDSRIALGHYQMFPDEKTFNKWTSRLMFWDTSTGRELAALNIDSFFYSVSPDGRLFAATSYETEHCKVYVIDLAESKLSKTIELGDDTKAGFPEVSADNRWVAVPTRTQAKDTPINAKPEDRPQTHVKLIDLGAGVVHEDIILPPGAWAPKFSPDGKMLATAGVGRIYLWDMTTPPGELKATREDKGTQ